MANTMPLNGTHSWDPSVRWSGFRFFGSLSNARNTQRAISSPVVADACLMIVIMSLFFVGGAFGEKVRNVIDNCPKAQTTAMSIDQPHQETSSPKNHHRYATSVIWERAGTRATYFKMQAFGETNTDHGSVTKELFATPTRIKADGPGSPKESQSKKSRLRVPIQHWLTDLKPKFDLHLKVI